MFPLVSTLGLGLPVLLELESFRSPAVYRRTATEWGERNILISQRVSTLGLGLACSLPSAVGMPHLAQGLVDLALVCLTGVTLFFLAGYEWMCFTLHEVNLGNLILSSLSGTDKPLVDAARLCVSYAFSPVSGRRSKKQLFSVVKLCIEMPDPLVHVFVILLHLLRN